MPGIEALAASYTGHFRDYTFWISRRRNGMRSELTRKINQIDSNFKKSMRDDSKYLRRALYGNIGRGGTYKKRRAKKAPKSLSGVGRGPGEGGTGGETPSNPET
jgi:hypothetical protein